ncbi:hypothetical protein [Streptomyces sp. NBC_00385]|uniref:hypothetical protein n=1 Tax=Streptomyces sp. NBC_00385 TaxID=2975733 RepID=UPI002DD8B835|nr:hypothetical protein [Streptomyces sp. NBC_00385]WRZ03747.1 hypothetical protein OG959_10500 [Streptomyces sp. NBC_00385]
MTIDGVHDLLVQARGEPSPLYELPEGGASEDVGAYTLNVPLDRNRLFLPADLLDTLRSWSLSRPPDGSASRPGLNQHVEQGLAAAQRLARHLGPSWSVLCWDERRSTVKRACWSCVRLHWARDSHDAPSRPVDITVEGEFGFAPLRADEFGDFAPDDPAAGLALSDGLVADLYAWSDDIDRGMNRYLRDRDEDSYHDVGQRQYREGRELARRLAQELGPARKVTYKGMAHGGPLWTSVTWRGERLIEGESSA